MFSMIMNCAMLIHKAAFQIRANKVSILFKQNNPNDVIWYNYRMHKYMYKQTLNLDELQLPTSDLYRCELYRVFCRCHLRQHM
mmetsp:Transcript_1593/g.5493  ORF Transcript_1593/g.5493 Transcript_1593/m.5493 type:complete len:83 (+) Transcript_1593:1432-1680(+)